MEVVGGQCGPLDAILCGFLPFRFFFLLLAGVGVHHGFLVDVGDAKNAVDPPLRATASSFCFSVVVVDAFSDDVRGVVR